MKDWLIQDGHVIPLDDLSNHTFDEQCLCDPELNEDGVIIHNAYDKREQYESTLN